MANATNDRERLLQRIVELLGTAKSDFASVREHFADMSDANLTDTVAQLEAASVQASGLRKPIPELEERRAAALDLQQQALGRLDLVIERIKARRAAAELDSAETSSSIAKLVSSPQTAGSITPSIEIVSALSAAEPATWPDFNVTGFRLLTEVGKILTLAQVKSWPLSVWQSKDVLENTAIESYLQYAVQKASWDVIRILGSHAPPDLAKDKAFNRLIQLKTIRTAAFDPVFIADLRPLLTPTLAAEALAKLSLFAADFGATRIISTGAGGDIVGGFLAHQLPRVTQGKYLHWTRGARILADWSDAGAEDDKILIVTDVASSTERLEELRTTLAEHHPERSIVIVAVAARANVRDYLLRDGLFYCTNLSVGSDVVLPWAGRGTYSLTNSNHIFGYSGPKPFVIARSFMRSVTNSLRALVGARAG